jgi:hypothetical protein
LQRARARASVVLALLTLVLALAPASPAVAAGFEGAGALNNLTEGSSEEAEAPTKAASKGTATENSGKSSTVVTFVIVLGGVLLAGIAFVIMRDARKWAPTGDAELVEGGPAGHSPAAMQKRRAKAKAARRQRKRNR